MIKCKWNKKTDKARFRIKGDAHTLAIELLAIIREIYSQAPITDRLLFRGTILHGLKEDGPVWKSTDTKNNSQSSENS